MNRTEISITEKIAMLQIEYSTKIAASLAISELSGMILRLDEEFRSMMEYNPIILPERYYEKKPCKWNRIFDIVTSAECYEEWGMAEATGARVYGQRHIESLLFETEVKIFPQKEVFYRYENVFYEEYTRIVNAVNKFLKEKGMKFNGQEVYVTDTRHRVEISSDRKTLFGKELVINGLTRSVPVNHVVNVIFSIPMESDVTETCRRVKKTRTHTREYYEIECG